MIQYGNKVEFIVQIEEYYSVGEGYGSIFKSINVVLKLDSIIGISEDIETSMRDMLGTSKVLTENREYTVYEDYEALKKWFITI